MLGWWRCRYNHTPDVWLTSAYRELKGAARELVSEDISRIYVDNWVSIATRGLCDDAKARIAEEIKQHYAEALESAMRETAYEIDVHRVAYVTLGNPHRARRAFLRTYFTPKESEILGALKRGPKDLEKGAERDAIFWFAFFAVWLPLLLDPELPVEWVIASVLEGVYALDPIVRKRGLPRVYRFVGVQAAYALYALWPIVMTVAISFTWAAGLYRSFADANVSPAILLWPTSPAWLALLAAGYYAFTLARSWRKITSSHQTG